MLKKVYEHYSKYKITIAYLHLVKKKQLKSTAIILNLKYQNI